MAVSNATKYPQVAHEFIKYITTDPTTSEKYFFSSNNPPALRTLIQKYINHPDIGVFAREALRARSWPQIDNIKISQSFSTAVSDVLMGKISSSDALERVENEVSNLMEQSLR